MTANSFFLLFLVGEFLSFLLGEIIAFSTYFHRKRGGEKIPPFAEQFLDRRTEERSDEYYRARFAFGQISATISFILGLALVLLGYYPWLYSLFDFSSMYIQSVLFLTLMEVPGVLLGIPFSLYREFVLEKRFGFSNTTAGLWLSDLLKNTLISLVLNAAIFSALVAILFFLGSAWWYVAGIFLIVFSLGFTVIYPIWIQPLFNKYVPLENGSLRDRLTELLEAEGFSLKKVFVVDESRRSNHSNAYCSGFGRNKRIVLYDSLMKTLSEDEIVAVFAHELGHARKKHIAKRLSVSFVMLFIALKLASLFIMNEELFRAFGFEEINPAVGLFLVFLVFSNYPSFLSWIGNYFSRKQEREADEFAKMKLKGGLHLASALMKLQAQNLSNSQPSKLEVFFNYSHPTVFMRVEYLLEEEK
ncbi:MAG: M48 family metallopeptidase [Spirochaetales bacterium]|nr:M48 family metallopeptidase [Spirochaetales bacterium]